VFEDKQKQIPTIAKFEGEEGVGREREKGANK
jgi:hypothetical protein